MAETVFYDPMHNEWSIRSLNGKWEIIRTKVTKDKAGKEVRASEVIAPKMTSSRHPALCRLMEMVEIFGWDKLKSNEGKFVEDNPKDEED